MTATGSDDTCAFVVDRRQAMKLLGVGAFAALLPDPFHATAAAQLPPLDFLSPVALDGSPAQAFASHRARAAGIARYFAATRPLSKVVGQANEDNTVALIGHFHAVRSDPAFTPPGAPASATEAPAALRRLQRGTGLVGTDGASTKRDYDMAVKGLVTLAYRYGDLLDAGQPGKAGVDVILDDLMPASLQGGHPADIEIVEQSFLDIDTPETENHLLMIESSRYLINQLRLERTGDRTFDNRTNGLMRWLLDYMQRVPRFDFLEFNSRPYARLSLHALLNLQEFARDPEMRTAAQILLDYTMMKFALSSNRGRRVGPFRRQQHRINHQANGRDDLYASNADEVCGFFLASTGLVEPHDAQAPVAIPLQQAFNALLGGASSYRPPPAAYTLALDRNTPASLHRFFHGHRPRLPAGEDADPGLEIYYHSPSFLLTAGGQFLNSGYGSDEVDLFSKQAWEQTARAQATTLIPTRADTRFHDLLRFEPYPDPQVDPYADDRDDPDCYHTKGVNIGVTRGFMAGANLRPAEKKTVLEDSTSAAPALALHGDRLMIAWKGSGNDNLNVATVQATSLLGIDGVEGIQDKTVLGETSDAAPAIASDGRRLFLAWRGHGNEKLNLAFSEDFGATWKGKTVFGDTSDHAPALAVHDNQLFLAWTGRGNEKLNLAKAILTGNTAGALSFGLEDKRVLGDTSSTAPALASHGGRLFLAWKGSGNDNLNLMASSDAGASFQGKQTFGETSSHAPALASSGGRLCIAWKGSGNENLNVAKVVLIGNTAGGFGIEGLTDKVTLGETSTEPPTLGSWNGCLCLGWRGEGEELLNLRISRDGLFRPLGPWIFADLTPLGFYLAAYRVPVTHPDQLVVPLDTLGFVHVAEKADMDRRQIDFARFRTLTEQRNAGLPRSFDYGGFYEFQSADDRRFRMWFELTGAKYAPRVSEIGDPEGDFTTLPLVSGDVMRSPGGHDGRIEIQDPAAPGSPLVLDYRDAANPIRIDTKVSQPGPWIDRVLALFTFAPRLIQLSQPLDMHAALADAAFLYDEMLRLNPDANGPRLAPGVIQGLGTIGIDFSVSDADLREWLANPDFTPYPAIAAKLLSMGRRLKAPVYIDVVAFNYENTPGVASPRQISDLRDDVLAAALLAAWNVRYGATLTDANQIFA